MSASSVWRGTACSLMAGRRVSEDDDIALSHLSFFPSCLFLLAHPLYGFLSVCLCQGLMFPRFLFIFEFQKLCEAILGGWLFWPSLPVCVLFSQSSAECHGFGWALFRPLFFPRFISFFLSVCLC